MARYTQDSGAESPILRWVGEAFLPYQYIPWNYVPAFDFVTIGTRKYLLGAMDRSRGQQILWRWNGGTFQEFQTIGSDSSSGDKLPDNHFFEIAGEQFLATAKSSFGVEIYKWNGAGFVKRQVIPIEFVRSLVTYTGDGEHFIGCAVRDHFDPSMSQIYRWNGATEAFEFFQDLPDSAAALNIAAFEVTSKPHLALSSPSAADVAKTKIYRMGDNRGIGLLQILEESTGYSSEFFRFEDRAGLVVPCIDEVHIYFFDEEADLFILFQRIPAASARSATVFQADGRLHVVVAQERGDDALLLRWGPAPPTTTVLSTNNPSGGASGGSADGGGGGAGGRVSETGSPAGQEPTTPSPSDESSAESGAKSLGSADDDEKSLSPESIIEEGFTIKRGLQVGAIGIFLLTICVVCCRVYQRVKWFRGYKEDVKQQLSQMSQKLPQLARAMTLKNLNLGGHTTTGLVGAAGEAGKAGGAAEAGATVSKAKAGAAAEAGATVGKAKAGAAAGRTASPSPSSTAPTAAKKARKKRHVAVTSAASAKE